MQFKYTFLASVQRKTCTQGWQTIELSSNITISQIMKYMFAGKLPYTKIHDLQWSSMSFPSPCSSFKCPTCAWSKCSTIALLKTVIPTEQLLRVSKRGNVWIMEWRRDSRRESKNARDKIGIYDLEKLNCLLRFFPSINLMIQTQLEKHRNKCTFCG